MKMWVEDSLSHDSRIYTVEVSRADWIAVRLDSVDRAILATPHAGIADALQDLQLLAFRLEQQKGEK